MMASQPNLALYSAHDSSCCQRIWIALAHKNLDYTVVAVNLGERSNQAAQYRDLNPSARVPMLEVDGGRLRLRNSLTILTWLEDAFPDRPALLPPAGGDWIRRAAVLDLVALIIADVQPVQNNRVCRRAGELAAGSTTDREEILKHAIEWRATVIREGLKAYDAMIDDGLAGKYSVGDDLTLADVVLYSQATSARHVGIDVVEEFPNIGRIWPNVCTHPSVVTGGDATKQPDHPDSESRNTDGKEA
ncbi:unnamed protein product [Parajaminaea phylloscopi]